MTRRAPSRIARVIATAVVAATAVATAPFAGAADPIEWKEYNDEGYYYFRYPSTCTIKWWSQADWVNTKGTVTVSCQPGQGYDTFNFKYGAGDDTGTRDEFFREGLRADGQDNSFQVTFTPHQLDVRGQPWSNAVIFPVLN